jgi:hypothetical protein
MVWHDVAGRAAAGTAQREVTASEILNMSPPRRCAAAGAATNGREVNA